MQEARAHFHMLTRPGKPSYLGKAARVSPARKGWEDPSSCSCPWESTAWICLPLGSSSAPFFQASQPRITGKARVTQGGLRPVRGGPQ